jgi:hypothetical protein
MLSKNKNIQFLYLKDLMFINNVLFIAAKLYHLFKLRAFGKPFAITALPVRLFHACKLCVIAAEMCHKSKDIKLYSHLHEREGTILFNSDQLYCCFPPFPIL